MQEQTTTALKTVFSNVLANLAFMFSDDVDVELSPGEVWLETTIGYHGPVGGTLRLRCTRDFSIVLAANLLGTDPNDHDAKSKADDAVKEFMNVLCGQFVTELHGTEDVFTLSIPQIRELPEPPDLAEDGDGECAVLPIQGHQVQLQFVPD